jgi:hypothetical protein
MVLCRWGVLVAAVLLGIWPTVTRAAPVARVVISQVDMTHLPEVSIVLSALDSTGTPITGLGQASFQVLEDGNVQKITSVGPATEGMTFVIAMDTSGSMADVDAAGHVKIDEARKAAEQFVNTTQQLNAGKSTTPASCR